jgi:hypothetical protein
MADRISSPALADLADLKPTAPGKNVAVATNIRSFLGIFYLFATFYR